MAILTIAGIAALQNTSWELGQLNIAGQVGNPTRKEEINFGSSVLNPADVIVDTDREINCQGYQGGTLTADEDPGGDAINIKFNYAGTVQDVQELDLTGTKLTIRYSSDYYEVYDQL